MKTNKFIMALLISMLLISGSALASNNKVKLSPQAYNALRAMVDRHINTANEINNYVHCQATLASGADLDALGFIVMDSPARIERLQRRLKGLK